MEWPPDPIDILPRRYMSIKPFNT